MNTNKIIIYISIITFIFVITVPSVISVNKKHKDDLYKSITLKIEESAKKCSIQKKCLNKKIFLKELYDYKYIDKQINPYTKKYISEDSYVQKKDNKYVFILAE